MSRPRDRYGRPLPEGSRDELRAGPPPRSISEALRRGIDLFNRRRFFEAHDCFEWAWKAPETDERERGFWKALAQIAVGCCHLQRGNPGGGAALLERGARRLAGIASPHRGIDTGRLRADALALARDPRADFPGMRPQDV